MTSTEERQFHRLFGERKHREDTFIRQRRSSKVYVKSNNPHWVSVVEYDPHALIVRVGLYRCPKLNYRLDFIKYTHFWGGPVATLVPTANAHVWGVVYRLDSDDLVSLDDQKGVDEKKYYVKYLDVMTPYMGTFKCRSYIQKVNPLPRGDHDAIPVEYWPSWTYKQVLIMGAKEHGLPECYIKGLKKLQDNGEEGWLRVQCLLVRYGGEQLCACEVPGRIPRKPLKLELIKNVKNNNHKNKTLQF